MKWLRWLRDVLTYSRENRERQRRVLEVLRRGGIMHRDRRELLVR